MMLPMITEDVDRCTQELSVAKGQLALALTGACPEETLSALASRKEALDRELEIARELLAEARRVTPLLEELKKLSGLSSRPVAAGCIPDACADTRAGQFFRIPDRWVLPERRFAGSALNVVRAGMPATGTPLSEPVPAPYDPAAAPVARPVESGGTLRLREQPKPAQPSATKSDGFGSSLFGKLFAE